MNEVARIKAELEEALGANDGKATLKLLESLVNIPMTVEILQNTHIGMVVNKIRKSIDHAEAISLSKKVVKKWKKVIEASKEQTNDSGTTSQGKDFTNSSKNGNINNNNGSSNNTSDGSASLNNNNNSNSQDSTCIKTTSNSNASPAANSDQSSPTDPTQRQAPSTSRGGDAASSSSSSPRQVKTDGGTSQQQSSASNSTSSHQKPSFIAKEVPQTSSAVRLKFRSMITDALKHPLPKELQTDEPFLDEESLAARMEECIYQEFKSDSDMRYRHRIRSRISNLKDNKNPYLRLNVLRGDISAERIAKMETTEMASDELKRKREQFTREAINDHQMALTAGANSSEIKCPACKKYDCSYNQMQTRSADEPMTTFCHCNNCGKRWKFC